MSDVTNPGSTNAADEAFGLGLPTQTPDLKQVPAQASPNNADGGLNKDGLTVVDQEILVGPSQNAGVPADGDDPSQKKLIPQGLDQAIVVGVPQTAGTSVDGTKFQPGNANIQNTTANNVASQVYGTGTPANVNV